MAFERFEEARAQERPEAELLRHLNEAPSFYHQALACFPADAVAELAVAHNQLGMIYGSARDVDRAVAHYRESIQSYERQGDLYHAAIVRRNIALALAQSGRLQDALEYARAALRGFESYGESAAGDVKRTRQLIEEIEGLQQRG